MAIQRFFGVGHCYGVRTDIPNSNPIEFGAFQGIDLGFDFTNKPLMSQGIFPLDIGRGVGKVTIKIKAANFTAQVFNDIFFGMAVTTGDILPIYNEGHLIPDSPGPYTILAAHVTGIVNNGVTFADGTQMTLVTTTPTTGQYEFDATTGTYTFAAADKKLLVYLNYTYTDTGGNTITLVNQLQGNQPYFSIDFNGKSNNASSANQKFDIKLNRCVASKLTFAPKMSDWTIWELDAEALDDGTGNIGTFATTT